MDPQEVKISQTAGSSLCSNLTGLCQGSEPEVIQLLSSAVLCRAGELHSLWDALSAE